MILHGQSLIDTLRARADSITKRLWLAAHYVGDPTSVQRILGTRWVLDDSISLRLLIDSTHVRGIDGRTMDLFRDKGDIAVLPGLHAKLFICDDTCLVTSANLTDTAFSKRYEMGVLLDGAAAGDAISVFEQWWAVATKERRFEHPEADKTVEGLAVLWTLPSLENHEVLPQAPINLNARGRRRVLHRQGQSQDD